MPGNDDDDKIIRHKIAAQAEEAAKHPVTLKLWVVAAIALAAFVLGAVVF